MIAAALLLLPSQVLGAPPPVQPATHVSPAGSFRLHVDPTSCNGSGPAWYRLEKEGEEVWSGERPFTLSNAVVDDRGYAGGTGYSEGFAGQGSFEVVVLSPGGQVLLREEHPRGPLSFLHTPRAPYGTGLFLVPERDLLVVRVRDDVWEGCSEAWWCYALHGDVAVTRSRLDLGFAEGEVFHVHGAAVVPGTPLTLVHASAFQSMPHGACFALLEPRWEPVWTLRIPWDYHAAVQEERTWVERFLSRPGGLSTSPGRFTVPRYRDRQLVTYGVASDPGEPSGWRVTELERRPLGLDEEPALSWDAPRVGLREIASVHLGPADGPSDLQVPRTVKVDRFGRIALGDECSHAVHVFDSTGEPLFRLACRHDIATLLARACVNEEGDWLLPQLRESRHVVFDRDGARKGFRRLGNSVLALSPGSSEFWVRHDKGPCPSLLKRTADGTVTARVERAPDGRWLTGISALAVSARGELAVVARFDGTHAALALYSPEGEAERQIDLPCFQPHGYPTVVHGMDWILVSDQARSVYLVRRANGEVLDVSWVLGPESRREWGVGLSPDETELWCVDPAKRTLHRFGLPD